TGADVPTAAGVGAFAFVTEHGRIRQIPDLGGADFADQRDLFRAQPVARTDGLGEGRLDLAHLMAIPALHVFARTVVAKLAAELQARLRNHRVERGETGKEKF